MLVLCEDDALIRMATAEMLQDMGHAVIATGTAKAALAALADHRIDILITDVGLPDMLGTRLVEVARQKHSGLAVIFATGRSEVDGHAPDATTEILTKPYGPADLVEALERLRPT